MTQEWLNNGEALPATHRKAGQLGLKIDFEDGREPQFVYAADKDTMLSKLATMYGNTQIRIAQVKQTGAGSPAHPPTSATPGNPAAAPIGMNPEEQIQAVADLGDPAKAPEAISRLIKQWTGRDLKAEAEAERATQAAQAEVVRLQGEVDLFLAEHPDFPKSKRNGQLLRDRAFALTPNGLVTAADFAEAYEQLRELDVFQDAPPPSELPPAPKPQEHDETATNPPHPSGEPAARPRVSTGIRPSQLRSTGRVTTEPTLTRAQIEAIAGTDEYAERLQNEPGFAAMVDKVLSQ